MDSTSDRLGQWTECTAFFDDTCRPCDDHPGGRVGIGVDYVSHNRGVHHTYTSVRPRVYPGIVPSRHSAPQPTLWPGRRPESEGYGMRYDTIIVGGGTAGCILAAACPRTTPQRTPPGSRARLPGPRTVAGYAEIWLGCHQSGSTAGRGSLQLVPGRDGECAPAHAHARAPWQGHRRDERDQWPDVYSGAPEDFATWAAWEYRVVPRTGATLFQETEENDADFRDAFHGMDGPIPVRRFPRVLATHARGVLSCLCRGRLPRVS